MKKKMPINRVKIQDVCTESQSGWSPSQVLLVTDKWLEIQKLVRCSYDAWDSNPPYIFSFFLLISSFMEYLFF